MNHAYIVRDHEGSHAVGAAFETRTEALTFMHEARGVGIIDGLFLADGYYIEMVEIP